MSDIVTLVGTTQTRVTVTLVGTTQTRVTVTLVGTCLKAVSDTVHMSNSRVKVIITSGSRMTLTVAISESRVSVTVQMS